MMDTPRLTQFSHGSGCGCKIAPAVLDQILKHQGKEKDNLKFNELLVGYEHKDDAAVWDLGNDDALVSTVDFFMPIVDNARDFGRISACNAISDIYAMGARPLFANAILGWPVDKLPVELAAEVLDGARQICMEANIPLAGGHSINSTEPMFGLAVNGIIKTTHIKKNSTAQAGDLILVTKQLGTGILGAALKRGMLKDEAHLAAMVKSMTTLNKAGAELASMPGVHAMTDITGFGLLGHLIEMCEGSGVSAEIDFGKIPVFDFIDEYLQQNIIPDNTYRNWNSFEKKVEGISDMRAFQLLNDPQTSGGLLIAVKPEAQKEVLAVVDRYHDQGASLIGKFIEKTNFDIRVF